MPTKVVNVRMDTDLLNYLQKRADAEHRTISNMIISLLLDAKERDMLFVIQEIQKRRNLRFDDISELMGERGSHISKSMLARIFAPDAYLKNFDYHVFIEPIAEALLEYDTNKAD